MAKNLQNNNEEMAMYSETALWCNENNATIDDKGEYYEVVAIPEPTLDELKIYKKQH